MPYHVLVIFVLVICPTFSFAQNHSKLQTPPHTPHLNSGSLSSLPPEGVPTLEELTSDWQLFTAEGPDMPRHGMGLPTANSLLGSVIGDVNVLAMRSLTLPPYTQGPFAPVFRNQSRFGRLLLNGDACDTSSYQWTPYSFRRRCKEVTTEIRLAFNEHVVMSRGSFAAAGSNVTLELFPEVRKFGKANCTADQWEFPYDMQSTPPCWNWYAPRPRANESNDFVLLAHDSHANLIVVADVHSSAIIAVVLSAQSTPYSSVREDDGGVVYHWSPPPSSDPILIEFVAVIGDRNEESSIVRRALNIAATFSTSFDRAILDRQTQFNNAFTPGNKYYSGHLPVLTVDSPADENISRIYYTSVISVLANERVGLPAVICPGATPNTAGRVFVTGGAENCTTNSFFWDQSYAATLLSLLDPEAFKCMIQLFYQQNIGGHDPTAGWGMDWQSGHAVGAWYAANDMALFKSAVYYVAVSGDFAFLNSTVDGVRVLDQMFAFATYWQQLTSSNDTLADYGGAHNLLECVPSYIHKIASFNAANVWMMRVLARLYQSLGDSLRAKELLDHADKVAHAVQTLYVAPDGVWRALYPNGSSTVVRHVIDLVYVSEFMVHDLSPLQSQQMLQFASRELLTSHWMRAQSLLDPYANFSDRTDHGPYGAYDGWPALVVGTFARQGRLSDAEAFLRSTAFATTLGPYGQAHGVRPPLMPYKPFEYTLFNALAGGGFADAIITSIFGLQAGEASLLSPSKPPILSPNSPRTIKGTLRNVIWQGDQYTVTCGPQGVVWAKQHGD